MLKNILKIIGLILIVVGVFPMIMQPLSSITGSVINYSSVIFRMNYSISLTVAITGVIFFLAGAIVKKP